VKKIIIILQMLCFLHLLNAQGNNAGALKKVETTSQLLKALETPPDTDSLKQMLATKMNDEDRAIVLFQLTTSYINKELDSSLKYVKQFNQIPSKTKQLEANGLVIMGDVFGRLGNASMALETHFKGLKILEDMNDSAGIGMAYWNIGRVYQSLDDNAKAISYYSRAMKIAAAAHEKVPLRFSLGFLGLSYMKLNRLDSALYYTQSASEIQMKEQAYKAYLLAQLGDIYRKSGNKDLAMKYYRMALEVAVPKNNFGAASEACIGIASLFKNDNSNDSCYYFARKGFVLAQQVNDAALILATSNFLKDFFKDKTRFDSAFKYQEIMISARDSLLSLARIRKVQDISFAEQERIQEAEAQKKEFQNKIKLYALIISLAVFLLIAVILYKNNRRKQKVNILLQRQKEEIQNTLAELKSTQAQLIQSEKMASLGELTAGIAHEIQNPLNFVNNFSDVNKELLVEMKDEMSKGNINDANAIANDVIDNEEKINHHGKRAEAIVKGMLQHSQASIGKKELTDINALCDEYLRLAYHGLRAKDKEFNAIIKTDFDESIGNINSVPQDIGRVLLNLYNNAFYAINEKKKQQTQNYEPTISIKTKKLDGKVEIHMEDNGNGIPQKIVDKIFQPFFTTKPTGQGTGLGLSLSYDIIKAHGGEIKVVTQEGEGSEFIIKLLINQNEQ